jgi:hypothetical protein
VSLYYLPAIAVYAAIATATALAYLGCASVAAWALAAYLRRYRRGRLSQPGEGVRSVLAETDGRLRRHATAMLLFVAGALLLSVFGELGWWADLPVRLWAVLAAGLIILQGYALVRLVQLICYRLRLARLLAMHEEVSNRLVAAQARGYHLHYAVPAGDLCVDTVITGENGVFALRILQPPDGAGTVRLVDGQLVFGPAEQRVSVVPVLAAARVLARQMKEATGLALPVQTVLVVPGCRIETTDVQDCLVVNLQTCVSFIGWQNGRSFLMEDDRRRIDDWLLQRTSQRDRATRRAVRETLGDAVPPPILV